jgi:hypothetical protein
MRHSPSKATGGAPEGIVHAIHNFPHGEEAAQGGRLEPRAMPMQTRRAWIKVVRPSRRAFHALLRMKETGACHPQFPHGEERAIGRRLGRPSRATGHGECLEPGTMRMPAGSPGCVNISRALGMPWRHLLLASTSGKVTRFSRR